MVKIGCVSDVLAICGKCFLMLSEPNKVHLNSYMLSIFHCTCIRMKYVWPFKTHVENYVTSSLE